MISFYIYSTVVRRLATIYCKYPIQLSSKHRRFISPEPSTLYRERYVEMMFNPSRYTSLIHPLWRHSSRKVLMRDVFISKCVFHTSSLNFANKEPIIPDSGESDRFLEMMDDRTNSLLRSLRIDVEKLKQDIKEHGGSRIAPGIRPSPFVEAVEVAANPLQAKNSTKSHFFDTQDVYSELRSAGLTLSQAEILMRTMQELIDGLVSTCTDRAVPVAAAANEAYLFDAASSEVRNEISNSRQTHATSYRSGLARLQRDVEILEHEAIEMTNLLKADLDIEVHERKNSARAEENSIQLKIQELHNKISTRLNSELKSEIENLRWQITRRSLAAIAVIAASLIWLTQTNSNKKTAMTQERERQSSGRAVHVPVLAPSVSPTDESFNNHSVQVEDIANFGGVPNGKSEPEASSQNNDDEN